jgi:hypothetical protein
MGVSAGRELKCRIPPPPAGKTKNRAVGIRTVGENGEKLRRSAVVLVGLIQAPSAINCGKNRLQKQKAHQSGPSREKSFWANARMARETLPRFGVYET